MDRNYYSNYDEQYRKHYPLHGAVKDKNLTKVRQLLQQEKFVDSLDNFDSTPLYICAISGGVDIFRLLKQYGANVNFSTTKKDGGSGLLHVAVSFRHTDIIRELIKYGVDVNTKDGIGRTPIHYVALIGDYLHNYDYEAVHILDVLVNECKADINAKEDRGFTLLHFVSSYGKTAIIQALLNKYRVDVNVIDNEGNTPLYIADSKVIRMLIECGARLDITNNKGQTPLEHARTKVKEFTGKHGYESTVASYRKKAELLEQLEREQQGKQQVVVSKPKLTQTAIVQKKEEKNTAIIFNNSPISGTVNIKVGEHTSSIERKKKVIPISSKKSGSNSGSDEETQELREELGQLELEKKKVELRRKIKSLKEEINKTKGDEEYRSSTPAQKDGQRLKPRSRKPKEEEYSNYRS